MLAYRRWNSLMQRATIVHRIRQYEAAEAHGKHHARSQKGKSLADQLHDLQPKMLSCGFLEMSRLPMPAAIRTYCFAEILRSGFLCVWSGKDHATLYHSINLSTARIQAYCAQHCELSQSACRRCFSVEIPLPPKRKNGNSMERNIIFLHTESLQERDVWIASLKKNSQSDGQLESLRIESARGRGFCRRSSTFFDRRSSTTSEVLPTIAKDSNITSLPSMANNLYSRSFRFLKRQSSDVGVFALVRPASSPCQDHKIDLNIRAPWTASNSSRINHDDQSEERRTSAAISLGPGRGKIRMPHASKGLFKISTGDVSRSTKKLCKKSFSISALHKIVDIERAVIADSRDAMQRLGGVEHLTRQCDFVLSELRNMQINRRPCFYASSPVRPCLLFLHLVLLFTPSVLFSGRVLRSIILFCNPAAKQLLTCACACVRRMCATVAEHEQTLEKDVKEWPELMNRTQNRTHSSPACTSPSSDASTKDMYDISFDTSIHTRP